MKEIIFILLFLLHNIKFAVAETNILTLQDCLDLAIKNNYRIKQEQINLQTAALDVDINKSAYYPELTLEADIPKYTEYYDYYQKETFHDYYYYHRLDNALKARVQTEIPTGADLSIELKGVYNIIDSENKEYRSDSQDVDYILSAKFTQPLLIRNITRIEISKKKAKLKDQKMYYRQKVKDIKHNVTVSYLNLLWSLVNYEIKENLYNKSKLNYELGSKKYETGLIPEVDALQLEVSYNRNQASLLETENQITKNKELLLFNMGLELDYHFKIVRDVSYKAFQIDSEGTLENTILKNYDINNMQYNIFLKDEEYIRIKDESNLNAYVSFFYNYSINQEPSPYYYAYNWGASLNLVYPLIDFGLSKKELKKTKKEIEVNRINIKNQEIALEKNLNNLLREIEENYKKISIYSNAVYVSQKRYDISLKQFQNGIITTLDLLTSESDLNTSEINYINAIINYKKKISELESNYEVVHRK